MMGKGKGKLCEICVTASEEDGCIVFAAKSDLPYHRTAHGIDTFTFEKKGNDMFREDFHLVQFTLVDKTTRNLRFPQNPEAALWACLAADQSNPQDSCPKTKPSIPSDQLKGLAVLNNHFLLAVNYNSIMGQQVAFALNFLGDDLPGGGVQWDPIGNNQNGGK